MTQRHTIRHLIGKLYFITTAKLPTMFTLLQTAKFLCLHYVYASLSLQYVVCSTIYNYLFPLSGASTLLTGRCHLRIIDAIKNNLQKENLEKFEQSCFGILLKINKLIFQGQMMVQLLLHMDMRASNKERLVFKINNSYMEFGPSDFFRITGLGFGKSEATITRANSSIHKDVFQDRPIIRLEDIRKAFLNRKGSSELKLKLALLYFLYGILLVKHHTLKIDMQYLHLIEDLQKFNAFPWGRVAYQSLVSSILKVRARMDSSEAAKVDLFGFCYALQVWAYEVMPSLAARCAYRANNSENLTPWILRWSAKLRVKDLKDCFTPGDKAHIVSSFSFEHLCLL